MSNLPQDIIFLAIIAIALIVKLISILGQKGNIKPDLKTGVSKTDIPNSEPIVIDKNLAPADQLKLIDPNYNESVFLSNAKEAFKMVLEAYAQGQTHVLSDLVDIEVMKKFAFAIAHREELKQTCEINILKIISATIENVEINNTIADITVKFTAEAIMNITNENKNIISGHQNKIDKLSDNWIFRRNLKSSDPTWKLMNLTDIPFAKA
jgi:predicted lipid-binding transport protein (Tim44 family)